MLFSDPKLSFFLIQTQGVELCEPLTVPKIIDFPRYNMKCSKENVILRGIFHVASCFPLHFMLYRGYFYYFLDRAATAAFNFAFTVLFFATVWDFPRKFECLNSVQKRDDLYATNSSRKISTTLLKPTHQTNYLRQYTTNQIFFPLDFHTEKWWNKFYSFWLNYSLFCEA